MARRSRTTAVEGDRPSSWWAEVSLTQPLVELAAGRTRRSLRSWPSSSPCTTTTGAAEATVATLPYAVERELQDIQALIAQVGGSAHLYSVSSGGAHVLEAGSGDRDRQAGGVRGVGRHGRRCAAATADYVEKLEVLLAEDCRGHASQLFMRTAGSPQEPIVSAKNSPMWPGLQAIAHTLAYDAACLGNSQPPTARLATITRPILMTAGGSGRAGRCGAARRRPRPVRAGTGSGVEQGPVDSGPAAARPRCRGVVAGGVRAARRWPVRRRPRRGCAKLQRLSGRANRGRWRLRSAAISPERQLGALRVADSGAGIGCGVVLGRCSSDRVSSALDAVRCSMWRPFHLVHSGNSWVQLRRSSLPP
jgi:hypothetical protein